MEKYFKAVKSIFKIFWFKKINKLNGSVLSNHINIIVKKLAVTENGAATPVEPNNQIQVRKHKKELAHNLFLIE